MATPARGLLVVLIVMALLLGQASGSLAAPTQSGPPSAYDFPTVDHWVWRAQYNGMLRKRAEQMFAEQPDSSETAELLIDATGRDASTVEAALAVLHRLAVAADLDDVEAAARIVSSRFSDIRVATFRGVDREDEVRELVGVIHERVSEMPPEQAARTVRSLLSLDSGYDEGRPGDTWRDKLLARTRAFIEQYAGTEAALEAELSLISLTSRPRDDEARRQRLEAFARAHPGTATGARALHAVGASLRMSDGAPRGSDPSDRLLRLLAIVRELESGDWPDCEWVDNAPELFIRFHPGLDPEYSSARIPDLIESYRSFIAEHFEVDGRQPLQYGIGWLVADRVAHLYGEQGNRTEGVDGFLLGLEQEVAEIDALRFLRAEFLLQEAANAVAAAEEARTGGAASGSSGIADGSGDAAGGTILQPQLDVDGLRARALTLLDHVVGAGSPPWAGRALATIASLHMHERDFELAADAYRRYLARWPDSDWAWLATLRLAQTHEATGDWPNALRVYQSGATAYREPALAAVFAYSGAARVAANLGEFEIAHRYSTEALEAWDDDYGPSYQLYTRRTLRPGPDGLTEARIDTITRADLMERVATLTYVLESPEGPLLESGRRLLERERWEDADAVLSLLIEERPTSPLFAEASYLAHHARFERALAIAAVESAQPDPDSAVELFRELSEQEWDPAVGAARLALAAMMGTAGLQQQARELTAEALAAWLANQQDHFAQRPFAVSHDGRLVDDVRAIRDLLFHPMGDPMYRQRGAMWSARDWPAGSPPRFFIVNPDETVQLATGETLRVRVTDPLPGHDNVLFLTDEHLGFFNGILDRLGGTETRPTRAIMEIPNQRVGDAMEILSLWREHFPARRGHWFGWVIESFPIITRIEFRNEERSEAVADITIGYSGCKVFLRKAGEGWTVERLGNFWIT